MRGNNPFRTTYPAKHKFACAPPSAPYFGRGADSGRHLGLSAGHNAALMV